MQYTFIIRRAEAADAPVVHAILRTAFEEYAATTGQTQLEALRETVADVERQIVTKPVYVAEIDGSIAGTVRLEITGTEAYLSRFAVAHEARNLGIGKSLMNVVDKYLAANGVTCVRLHPASRHLALVRFYNSRGFFTEAIETERGDLRARMIKEYVPQTQAAPAC
jgi:ribosomal protein S18 acetylase RimI-like enzyme